MSISAQLNGLSEQEAEAALTRCCGATRWVREMIAARPFSTDKALFEHAESVWAQMDRADILEAFDHHPRIGADVDALRDKFAGKGDLDWSGQEQHGAKHAGEQTLLALRDGNLKYEARFGHIFIVCATGKSAAQMLAILESRVNNDPEDELRIAAAEQAKITRLRLEKLS